MADTPGGRGYKQLAESLTSDMPSTVAAPTLNPAYRLKTISFVFTFKKQYS